TLDDVSGVPAWKTIPSWYLVARDDHLIPPAVQRYMANRAGAHTVEVSSSHVAMMSKPAGAADLITAAARACVKTGASHELHHGVRRRPDLLQGLGHRFAGRPQPRLAAQLGQLGGADALPGRARFPLRRPRPPRSRPVQPDVARQRDEH